MQWAIAAALICSSTVFTGCSKSDDNQEPVVKPEQPDDNGANSSSDDIGYIECSWNGTEVVKTPKVTTARDMSTLSYSSGSVRNTIKISGFYFISGSFTTDNYLYVDGWAAIILCDGADLKVSGIYVNNGGTLIIYAQEKGTGHLYAETKYSDDFCPAIGTYVGDGGKVEIHGGNVDAKGGIRSAGIGGGGSDDGHANLSDIIIYGGRVYGHSNGGAGIGAGAYDTSVKTNITIYDGLIEGSGGTDIYKGKFYGVGIGGGHKASFGSVNIYGGTVTASASDESAGIGAGEEAPNGEGVVNIYGGTVTAQGGARGAGIGGGDGRRLNEINIHGGEVYAYAGADGAGIGGGEGSGDPANLPGIDNFVGNSGNITITGGIVYAYGNKNYEGKNIDGYGAGIGSGQDGSVNNITITGGTIYAYGGEDAAGIGTGEEYSAEGINSGNIIIAGGNVFAQGKGYGAGIGAGEEATCGLISIGGCRVEARAGGDCGPWSGSFGAYHEGHGASSVCDAGWYGYDRIYVAKGMRLSTYSANVGHTEDVTTNLHWWSFLHQRPVAVFDVCDHFGYDEASCPYCIKETIVLR